MLTKEILFGMNILTLAGFIVMGLTLRGVELDAPYVPNFNQGTYVAGRGAPTHPRVRRPRGAPSRRPGISRPP